MKSKAYSVTLLFLVISMNTQGDDRYNSAVKFAADKDGCGLDHGYQCVQREEDDFIGLESDRRMVPGNYLKAWQVAVADFVTLEELESGQKDLKHYKFGFTETMDQYIVHFQALLLPELKDGEVEGTIRATYGLTARYWINKNTLTVEKRLFYKT
jgi:hypothetical protein